jgi:ketosteroid isomerase-like protein
MRIFSTVALLTFVLCFASPVQSQEAAADKRTPEVKQFVEHYFSTWSNVEMDAYADCFLNDAVVQFIDPRGQLHSQGKKAFIAEQRAVQSRNAGKETPETIEITFEPNLARAVVFWKLTMKGRVDYGYDHFTLARQDGKWKIVNLVFYKTDPPK